MAKVYSNKRRTLFSATTGSNPFADEAAPSAAELNAMLNFSSAVKWDSTDVGVQESDQIDDRVLTDAGTAKRAGFAQFGGTVNLLTPKDQADTADIAVQSAALFATENMRQQLWIADRIVPLSSTPIVAGNTINLYKVLTDAKQNQTEGENSYSYTVSLLPQGTVIPGYVVGSAVAGDIVIAGHNDSISLAGGVYTWGKATYEGNDITNLATWTSTDTTILTIDNHGIVTALTTGTASIVPSYPGAAVHAGLAITVAA